MKLLSKMSRKVFASAMILPALLFAACGGATVKITYKSSVYFSMDTDAQIVVADNFSIKENEEKYEKLNSDVYAVLNNVGKALSTTAVNSDIYNFNNAAAGAMLEISPVTYEVLNTALTVYEFTDHYYNPALYYNVIAYGFGTATDYPKKAEDLPDDELIAKYTSLAEHFGDIKLYEQDGKFYVWKPLYTVSVNENTLSMKLDLGGIGKGYAVDCVNKLFDEYGYEFGYFNFGTSSMLVKKHNELGDYKIALVNPRSIMHETFITVPSSDKMLSTSGDNEQYYIIDGNRYCHIIDPTTGKPVQTGIMSVTIIGGNASDDDAMTTAIMSMPTEYAIDFIERKLTDRKVVFTFETDGKYYYYTNMNENEYELNGNEYKKYGSE